MTEVFSWHHVHTAELAEKSNVTGFLLCLEGRLGKVFQRGESMAGRGESSLQQSQDLLDGQEYFHKFVATLGYIVILVQPELYSKTL